MAAANNKENLNRLHVKKRTVPSNEAATKRVALCDQQNRGLAAEMTIREVQDVRLCGNKLRRMDSNNVAPAAVAAGVAVKIEVLLPRAQLSKETVDLTRLPKWHNVPQAATLSSRRVADVADIDAAEIYDYMYEVEQQQPICPAHLKDQSEVTHEMRATLIDWINEMHLQLQLQAESFHLAVAIIDRYLQLVKDTKRTKLQLVGVSALLIATKYEERLPPAICVLVHITADTYTVHEIRQMELHILKTIDGNLSRPSPNYFLRRYTQAANTDVQHRVMSEYFVELASLDYKLASCKPSEIAAASLLLSLHLLNGNPRAPTGLTASHWTPTLVHHSRYTADHLRTITRQIAKVASDAPTAQLRAMFNKYQSNDYQRIALRTELRGPLMDSIVGQLENT
ncbi:G2/mitotic-specific cyclin-B [Drosophila grimshawi]|uniref:GH24705 n=1 Tax=Drosophila grimshawi TaxID=7222 RepID=B4JMX0_DROGR|nr:G2/mitotic-specific cyclin-B [Drosophila grimshawi]XP_043072027.1 G2/mitotic-specific cyclin-B [Drosophila grimshawi]EDV92063.1 GH24705 [Drosophila grimshawi]